MFYTRVKSDPFLLVQNVYESPPPVSVLSDFCSAHTPYFMKIHFNTIFPSTPGSSKWRLSLTLPHQILCTWSFIIHHRYLYEFFSLSHLKKRMYTAWAPEFWHILSNNLHTRCYEAACTLTIYQWFNVRSCHYRQPFICHFVIWDVLTTYNVVGI
jgi:hypothetical protein